VGGCRSPSGISYTVHADRDRAHQQVIAQPCTGSGVSRSRSSACTLGQAARRAEHPQRNRAAAILVFGCLQERWVRAFEILLRLSILPWSLHGVARSCGDICFR
jgi:hypothetical protein